MMKTFKLKKYINDRLDTTYTIPVVILRIMTAILPVSAIAELTQSGLKFNALIDASKAGRDYYSSTVIDEKGVIKRIELSIA